MNTIKTRESMRGIKMLDKAAVAEERMKKVFIRSKDRAANLMEDRQETPNEYAEEQVQYFVKDLFHDTANIAASGTKMLTNRGKKIVQQNWEKRSTKELDNAISSAERMSLLKADASIKEKPFLKQNVENLTLERNLNPPGSFKSLDRISATDSDNVVVLERSREFAKNQIKKRADIAKEIRKSMPQIDSFKSEPMKITASTGSVRKMESTTEFAVGSGKRFVHTRKQPDRMIRQTTSSADQTVTIKNAKNRIKTAPRTMKTAQKSSKVVRDETARQMVQMSKSTVKAAPKAAQTAVKSAKSMAATVKFMISETKALISLLLAGGWIAIMMILIVVLLGGAAVLFGRGPSNATYIPVSTEVEAYMPLIRQYAKQHGIPEYVELIKAVMMQESGGRGNDPMQASECGYNTRYPNRPNAITDPEYSVNVGIQNLAACLSAAEVQSPIDMDHIKLGLQGYNCVKRSWLKRLGEQQMLFRTITLRNQMSG